MKTSSFLLFDGFEHEEIIPPTSLLQWSFLVFYPSTVLDSVGLGTDMDGHTHTHTQALTEDCLRKTDPVLYLWGKGRVRNYSPSHGCSAYHGNQRSRTHTLPRAERPLMWCAAEAWRPTGRLTSVQALF